MKNERPKTPEEGLHFLADWFDLKYPNDPDGVQRDCRGWAFDVAQLRVENKNLRKAVEAKFKIDLKSSLLEGLVGGVFPDGALLATICEASKELADKDAVIQRLSEELKG